MFSTNAYVFSSCVRRPEKAYAESLRYTGHIAAQVWTCLLFGQDVRTSSRQDLKGRLFAPPRTLRYLRVAAAFFDVTDWRSRTFRGVEQGAA